MGIRLRIIVGAARKACRQDRSHRQPAGLAPETFASSPKERWVSGIRFTTAPKAASAGASRIRTSPRADGPEAAGYLRARRAFHRRLWTTCYGRRSATTYRRGGVEESQSRRVEVQEGSFHRELPSLFLGA